MGFRLRPAQPQDAGALSGLAIRAKSHWGYPTEWMDLWRAALTITPEYLSAHAGLVAVENDRPVGCCVLELRKGAGSLEHLWTEPEYHGRGIGRMLVTQALAMAAHAGVLRVVVIADPFAEGFYLKLGAARAGQVLAPMPGAPKRTLPVLEFAVEPA